MTDPDKDERLICARITDPLLFPDNRLGNCCECGWRVQFRPHAPDIPRLCYECGAPRIAEADEVVTTPQMIADVQTYLRKRKH
jgi:hypothetical protein